MDALRYRALRWLMGQGISVIESVGQAAGLERGDEMTPERFEALADAAIALAPDDVVGSVWKPIETAPKEGEFLVRGGELESEVHRGTPLDTVAHVRPRHGRFDVENGAGYNTWVNNPTHWTEIPK